MPGAKASLNSEDIQTSEVEVHRGRLADLNLSLPGGNHTVLCKMAPRRNGPAFLGCS